MEIKKKWNFAVRIEQWLFDLTFESGKLFYRNITYVRFIIIKAIKYKLEILKLIPRPRLQLKHGLTLTGIDLKIIQ